LTLDVRRKQWTEPVPPQPHRLVADVDAPFEQQVLDIAQRQRKPHYIITTSRITSGEEWKYRNGLAGFRGRGMPLPHPTPSLIAIRCGPFDSTIMTIRQLLSGADDRRS
jgi:hypothetical protein